MREDGANPNLCDDLDRWATEIYTACSFQDLTAQRIGKIVQTLRYLEGRINAMIAIWDQTEGELLPDEGSDAQSAQGSELPPLDLTQSDIDDVIVDQDLFTARTRPGADPEEPAFAQEPPGVSLDDPSEQIVFRETPNLPVPMEHHIRSRGIRGYRRPTDPREASAVHLSIVRRKRGSLSLSSSSDGAQWRSEDAGGDEGALLGLGSSGLAPLARGRR